MAPVPGGGRRHAPPGRRGAAGHDQRAGAVARAGRLRPARGGVPAAGRAGLLARQPARRLRVLGARGLRAADRAVAVLRLPPPRAAGQGRPLAPSPPGNLRQGAGPAARRGAADRDPAGRGQGGRPVVGLVRRQGRGGMAARHRRRHLRAADRVAAGLRPARAGAAGRAVRRGAVRPRVPRLPGRRHRPGARRGHPGGPGRISPPQLPDQREIPAHAAGVRRRAGGRADPGDARGSRPRGPGQEARRALGGGPIRRHWPKRRPGAAGGTASRCSRRSTH